MRPPSPLPRIAAGSRPCSSISRRTIGEVTAPPPLAAARRGRGRRRRRRRGGGAAGAGGAARSGRRRRRGRGGGAARRGRAEPGAARGAARRGARLLGDHREARADRHGLALLHDDLGDEARLRRGHLGVDLVGRHLEQRLVGVDLLADLLEPLRDRALGDRLTELRHRDVHELLDFFS